MRIYQLALAASSSALLLACRGGSGIAPEPLGPGVHRVRASPQAAAALERAGAVPRADYGAFRVLDAPEGALRAVGDAAGVEVRDDDLRIHLNSGDLDTTAPRAAALAAVSAPDGPGLHLVQFAGPIQPAWRAALETAGLRVVSYVPNNAYLVYGAPPAPSRLLRSPAVSGAVQFQAFYAPELKVDAALAGADAGAYEVQLVEDPALNEGTLALVASLARRTPRVEHALGYVNVVLEAGPEAVAALAERPDVVSVLAWAEPVLNDERQDMVLAGALTGGAPTGPGYLAWLAEKGFTQAQFEASGFGVDVSDSGLDNGTDQPDHPGLYTGGDGAAASRVAYVRLEGTPHIGSTVQGCDGHGTLNAHIIGGYGAGSAPPFADAQGYRFGLGVAPFVRLGSSVIFDPHAFTDPNFEDLLSRAYAAGMRVSSNSWGASSSVYDSSCQRYDALVRDAQPAASAEPAPGNQEMVIVFAAGNDGPGSGTVGRPGNAKNVLSAGASEGVQPFGGPDGCGVTDASADSAMDIAYFSSRGPAQDGRRRPDLLAPGTHISGGVAQAAGQRTSPPAIPQGRALSCFDASGVCRGYGGNFFPPAQQWYTASSGTSHSTPAIAGAAALLRQRFLNEGLAAPSPAMTKAFLVNSARYMTGTGAGDTLPSNSQGMGLLDLGLAFDGTARLLRDQEAEDLFTASGQTRTFSGTIGDPTKPFRVTLAWTDAPGPTFAAAWVNDLDLTVEVNGQVYRGNVFQGATSVTGGAADAKNNLESVFLPAGTSGPYTVTVTAANVNSDGVPGNGTALDQDFALVVLNSCGSAPPAAPTGVAVAPAGDNVLSVSWHLVAGAEQYRVFRSLTADGPWVRVGTQAAPPFVDAGRSGGTAYYYTVRAQSGCALSAPSAPASAQATGACLLTPAYAGLATAQATGEATCGVRLSWTAATPACGGSVRYELHRSTQATFTPGPENRVGITTAIEAVDAGMPGGTTYYYVVRAVESSPGAEMSDGNTVVRSAVPAVRTVLFRDDFDGNRPPSPDQVWQEVVLSGTKQLGLESGCHHQSPTTAYHFGTAGCGSYTVNVDNSLRLGGASGLAVPAGGGATLSFRLWYDLEDGYDSAVLGFSTAGPGGPFQAVGDAAASGVPYIVEGGYDRVVGSVRAWSGKAMGANGALKAVTVNLDALSGHAVWFAWTFHSDSFIPAAGVYLDDVVLEASSPACVWCTVTPPETPQGLTAAATAPNEITVSWTPAAVGGYQVLRATSAAGPFALLGEVAAPPFVDTGRSGGTRYHYQVRARQDCALSQPADASAVASGPCLLPPVFAGLAQAATAGSLTCADAISWAPATPSCGGEIAYDVFRGAPGFAPAPTNRIAAGVAATSYLDSGDLVSGTEYAYVVRAVESGSSGAQSDENTVARSARPFYTGGEFRDDFDTDRPPSPGDWWEERVVSGGDALGLVSGCHYQSATTAYRLGAPGTACGGSYAAGVTNRLVLGGNGAGAANGFYVHSPGARLTFRLWYDLASYYDGLSLEYSTTGSAGSFQPVPSGTTPGSPYISQGGYDGMTWAGVQAWMGYHAPANGSLVPVIVNLDALAGKTVWFAWVLRADYGGGREGAYLDDVALTGVNEGCSTTPMPPGSPVRLRVSGMPGTVAADGPITLSVEAIDENGQRATGFTGSGTVASSDQAAVLPPAVDFAGGMASVPLRLRTAGPSQVSFVVAGTPTLRGSAATTVQPGPASTLRFEVQPTSTTAGYSLWPAPAVSVADAFGNRVTASAMVSLSLGTNPGGATLSGSTTAATENGLATFSSLYVEKSGSGYRLSASATGLTPAQSDAFSVVAGSATRIAITAPASAQAGAAFSPPVEVTPVDVYGNPAQISVPVQLAISTGPAGASLGGTTTGSTAGGSARFDAAWLERAGVYQLVASTSWFGSATTGPLSVSPAAPSAATLLQAPTTARAGVSLDPPVVAALRDRFGNACTGASAPALSLYLGGTEPASLVGETRAAPVDGVVTFPRVAVDRPGEYVLYVGGDGIAGDVSAVLLVQPGPATQLVIEGAVAANQGDEVWLRATAADASGAVQPAYQGTATITSTDPTADLPWDPIPIVNGRSEPFRVVFHQPGPQQVTLADGAGMQGIRTVEVRSSTPEGSGGKGGGGCSTGGAGPGGLLALALLGAGRSLRTRRRGASRRGGEDGWPRPGP